MKKLNISILAMILITGYSQGLEASWWGSNNTKKLTEAQKQKLRDQMMQSAMQDVRDNVMTNKTGADAQTIAQNTALNQATRTLNPAFSDLSADDQNRYYETMTRKDDVKRKVAPNTGAKSKGYTNNPTLADQMFLEMRALKAENRALTAENQLLKQQVADLQNNNSAAQ